jgi:ActR/RegA family two-component response regulator
VEDDYIVASDLARALEERGAEVIGPAASIGTALKLVREQGALNGAVLDVDLRGQPVYPVADALRVAGVPFVFTTGYDEWIIPDIYAAVPRLEKPVDTRALARALSEIGAPIALRPQRSDRDNRVGET